MRWIPLDTNDAIQDLMDRFQWFHDACLRDASLVTETHIDADGGFNDDGGLDPGDQLTSRSGFIRRCRSTS